MAETPILKLPYPIEDDEPAGHTQIQALAEKLEELLSRPTNEIGDLKFSSRPNEHGLWIIADGRTLVSGAYPDYRQVLIDDGYAFGRDGNNPKIPDLRSRSAIGAQASQGRPHGAMGGQPTVGLTTGHMPWHNHGGATGWMDRNNPHGHFVGDVYPDGGQADGPYYAPIHGSVPVIDLQVGHIAGVVSTDINHLHAIGGEGGGAAHENMPPWTAGTWFIFAGRAS